MGPSRHRAGFTLIELMIVVSIIGISLVAFTPSFIQAMADRRAATASMELVRLGRRARSESIGLQRAFLLFVDYGRPALQTAKISLLRGNSTRCDVENWAVHYAACRATPDGAERGATECMEDIDLASTHWYHAPYAIVVGMWRAGQDPSGLTPRALTQAVGDGGGGGRIAICYEPSGATRWSLASLGTGAAMNFSQLNQGPAEQGGVMFAVGLYHRDRGEIVNTPRVALFPLGTTPRRLR